MADSKKYIGIYNSLEDVQDALDNGQLSKPYVAKTMDNGQLDYNSLSPVDYSQYWCTYLPIDAKIFVVTSSSDFYPSTTEYTGGDGKIPKADFPNFYFAGSSQLNGSSNVEKFKYFQFDSTSNTRYFNQAWKGCYKLTSFPMIDTAKGTNFDQAWNGCSKLASFPALDFHNGSNFKSTWEGCSSLTSFPLINTAKGTNFTYTWDGCSSLTEFPQLDLSSGTNFGFTWANCSGLTSFPVLDLSKGTSFQNTWQNCSSLTTLGGFGTIKENFDLSPCTKLTVDSLMNVINQAATVTGKTMTLGSENLNKLTDEQKAVATSKGWTLA